MEKFRFYFLWLSLICIVMFLLQQISSFTELFILNKSVFQGQIWRLITAIFLHGNLVHLIYNLFALLLFGLILEKTIGSKNFLILFFTSGIIANIISVNFYTNSLGASGAIMGIIGALTLMKPLMMVWAFGIILPMFLAAIIWVIGDILGVLGLSQGVGNIAHLSGILIGLIYGIILRIKNIGKTEVFPRDQPKSISK